MILLCVGVISLLCTVYQSQVFLSVAISLTLIIVETPKLWSNDPPGQLLPLIISLNLLS